MCINLYFLFKVHTDYLPRYEHLYIHYPEIHIAYIRTANYYTCARTSMPVKHAHMHARTSMPVKYAHMHARTSMPIHTHTHTQSLGGHWTVLTSTHTRFPSPQHTQAQIHISAFRKCASRILWKKTLLYQWLTTANYEFILYYANKNCDWKLKDERNKKKGHMFSLLYKQRSKIVIMYRVLVPL